MGEIKNKVICIQRKRGTYNNFEYDNYMVTVALPVVKSDKEIGTPIEVYKFKAKDVGHLNPMTWLNKSLEAYYDKNGNLISVNIND